MVLARATEPWKNTKKTHTTLLAQKHQPASTVSTLSFIARSSEP